MKWRSSSVLLTLLVCASIRGQTMQISGGFDQLAGPTTIGGIGITTWLSDGWQTTFGVGTEGVGASAQKKFPFGVLTLGDALISFNTPGAGLFVPVRGFALTRKTQLTTFTFFAGATGEAFTEPFLSMQHKFSSFGGGVLYGRRLARGFRVDGIAEESVHKWSAIGSVSETAKHWNAFLTGGLLQNHSLLDYGGTAREWIFTASVSRSTLVEDNLTATITNESVAAHAGPVLVGASHFAGASNGDSYYAFLNLGANTTARTMMLTAAGEHVTDIGVSRRFGPRWTITPSADRSNNAWSWSASGAFQSNLLTASISYEEQFVILATKNPWQKSLLVSVSTQLPGSAKATVRSFLDPTGRVRWTGYGGKFLTGPMGPTQDTSGVTMPSFGKYLIAGTVVDRHGDPVAGAAVRIGKTLVFSDSAGYFECRVKNHTYEVQVVVEEFALGSWKVVSAPATATPKEPIRITVVKL